MRFERNDPGYERIATFDIETTHWDASRGELVSIGLALHERGTPIDEAEFQLLHRTPTRDEATLIKHAYEWLDNVEADVLVSFNGRDFDFPFCRERLQLLDDAVDSPAIHTPDTHLDLFYDDRKDLADQRGEKWPGLEDVLESYGETVDTQMWRGEPLDNTRFGEELGPAVLEAIENDDQRAHDQLLQTVEEYLQDDLEKNLRIYYYDIGELTPPVTSSR